MTVQLSSLRVTADMDVSSYVRAAAEKENADKKITASSREAGQALAAQDALAQKVGSGVASLSRQYIEGYAQAAKFEQAVRQVGAAMDRGMDAGRAAAALDGIYRKFGQVADAAALSERGFVSLAPIVAALNREYEEMAAAQNTAATSAMQLARAIEYQHTLNTRLTGDRMGGRTVAYGEARDSADTFLKGLTEYERRLEQANARFHAAITQNTGAGMARLSARDSMSAFTDAFAPIEAAQRAETAQRAYADMFGIGRQGSSASASAATFSAEMDRLDEIAKQKAQQIGATFAEDLNSRLVQGVRKAARDSAAVFQEEMARQDAIERARAEQASQEFTRRFNESVGIGRSARSGGATFSALDEQARIQDEMQRSAVSMRQMLLPMEAETDRNRANLEEITKLEAARVISISEAAEMRRAEALRTEQARKSIEGMHIHQSKYASGVGLARNEVVNLSRQLQDVAVTLQAGQPLSTILMQQGTQILDIFTTSDATFKGFASQVATGARAIATSFAGIATGALAIGAALTWAGLRYSDSQREVERSLSGIGRASGMTVGDINAVSKALADQQRISVASARSVSSAFAATGRFEQPMVASLSGITRDFAAQMGIGDLTEAAKELAGLFADPARGADQLNQKLGFLTASTREYIRELTSQGRSDEARLILQQQLNANISGAAERVSILTRAWQALKNAVSNGVDAVGEAVAGQVTAEQRMQQALQRRAGLEASRQFGAAPGQRIAALNAEIEALQRQIDAERALTQEMAARAEAARITNKAVDLADSVQPSIRAIRELNDAAADLDKALSGTANRSALGPELIERVTRAREAFRNASETSLNTEQRIRAETELGVRAIMAQTLEEQKSVAIDRERLSLSGQKLTGLERELSIQREIAQVQAQANREARDALRTANDNASLAGLRPFQRAMREVEINNRNLRERTVGGPASVGAGGYVGEGPFLSGTPGARADGMDPVFKARVRDLIDAIGDSGARMTSGFRTREQQQALFDRYGPGRAARPGSSQHERGMAMDFVFSSPEARQRALEMASRYGVRALPSNGGAVHFDMGARGAGGGTAAEMVEAAKAAEQYRVVTEQIAMPLRAANDDLKAQAEILALQEQRFTSTAYQIGFAAKQQELMNEFTRQGVQITPNLMKEINTLADGYGRLNERAVTVRMTQDALFEREQLFRSPSEQGIASRLRGSGVGMDSYIAEMLRMNSALEQSMSLAQGFFRDFNGGLQQGKTFMEALTGATTNLATKLLDMAMDQAIRSMFSGLAGPGGLLSAFFGGGGSAFTFGAGGYTGMGPFLPSAMGNVFSGGNVVPFSKGGAFSNRVVSGPTYAPMALFGEKSEEAIMPLKRGRDGALGVAVTGRAGGAANSNAPVQIVNNVINQAPSTEVTQQPNSSGGTDFVIRQIEGGIASRATRGRGPLAPAISNPAYRVG